VSYETILVEHEGAADWLTLNRLRVEIDGFGLHAAVRCGADDRQALEQLCRYITRPALAMRFGSQNSECDAILAINSPSMRVRPGAEPSDSTIAFVTLGFRNRKLRAACVGSIA